MKQHLAGVIVTSDIARNHRYAATQVPNVRPMEYDLKVEMRGVFTLCS